MENPAAALDAIAGDLAAAFEFEDARGLPDEALLQTTAALERLGRVLASRQISVSAEIDDRSRRELGVEGLAAKKGCRTASELLERLTRASGETIAKRLKIARATRTRISLLGERMPATFPSVGEALEAGELGVDSALFIVRGLSSVAAVVEICHRQVAEYELVAAATGTGPDSPVPCTAEETKVQTDVWRTRLDQDGRLPVEERAMRMRAFVVGREREDGLVPVRAALLPGVLRVG